MTRFRSHVGIDDGRADLGGALFPGGTPSVVFQVFHDGPTPEQRASQLVRLLLNTSIGNAKREEVARDMSRSKEGGLQLVDLAAQGTLPKEFSAMIAEHTRLVDRYAWPTWCLSTSDSA